MSNYFKSVEYAHVKSTMSTYTNTTNMPCILINEVGITLHHEGPRRGYCTRLEGLIDGGKMCQTAHLKSSQQSVNLGEAYISYCPAGLVYFTVAISSGQVFKGAIIAGPIHMSEPDDYEVNQVASKYGLSRDKENELILSYNKIPILSPMTARFHLNLLTILAKDIMKTTKEALDRKKAFYEEQRYISEKIQTLKEEKKSVGPENQVYPIGLEKTLSSAIIKGDEQEAKKILNDILGFVFYKYRGDNRKIIAVCK